MSLAPAPQPQHSPADAESLDVEFLRQRIPLFCECGQPADTLHLLPDEELWPPTIIPACSDWSPGGYWFELDDFWNDIEDWARHLHGKSPGGWRRLVNWLLARADENEMTA